MTYEEEFLEDFAKFVDAQIPLMEKAQKMAEQAGSKEAAIRYESRLDAYTFLASKFENYRNHLGFNEMPNLNIDKY